MKYMTCKEHSEDETCACHMVFSPRYTIVGTFRAYVLIFPRYLIFTRKSRYKVYWNTKNIIIRNELIDLFDTLSKRHTCTNLSCACQINDFSQTGR